MSPYYLYQQNDNDFIYIEYTKSDAGHATGKTKRRISNVEQEISNNEVVLLRNSYFLVRHSIFFVYDM